MFVEAQTTDRHRGAKERESTDREVCRLAGVAVCGELP
jgi:hypothetical protein